MIPVDVKRRVRDIYHRARALEARMRACIRPPAPAIIVLGNGKAGTSAIAALLAERTAISCTIDVPALWHPTLTDILEDRLSLSQVVNRSPRPFFAELVKEPCLSFMVRQVRDVFPDAAILFIVRDPRDNIRSMLNRMGVPGHLKELCLSDYRMPAPWRAAIECGPGGGTGNYVAVLARQWVCAVDQYLAYAPEAVVVTYETFAVDKQATIDGLATYFGLTPQVDIAHRLDHQFQPSGKTVRRCEFFGSANLRTINEICSPHMSRFGYSEGD